MAAAVHAVHAAHAALCSPALATVHVLTNLRAPLHAACPAAAAVQAGPRARHQLRLQQRRRAHRGWAEQRRHPGKLGGEGDGCCACCRSQRRACCVHRARQSTFGPCPPLLPLQLWDVRGKFRSAAVGVVPQPAAQMVAKQNWTYSSAPGACVKLRQGFVAAAPAWRSCRPQPAASVLECQHLLTHAARRLLARPLLPSLSAPQARLPRGRTRRAATSPASASRSARSAC